MTQSNYEVFRAGEILLESGETLPDARLAFRTFGRLNETKTNAVIVLTFFGGTHDQCGHLMGEGHAVDPSRYFVIVVNLMGNGVSSSPSNSSLDVFPIVTVADNVRLQHRLVVETFGITQLALVLGHSMGAAQTYHWAAMFPEFVERAAPICGSAKTSRHNDVFLRGMRGILMADPVWAEGRYTTQPIDGLRTMARAWAAWPPSSHFYRNAYYETLGFNSLDDFIERYWEATYTGMDANNVLTQIETWRSSDISNNKIHQGDFPKSLASIKARMVVMPCTTDAYFPPEDSEIEVSHMTNASLQPIKSNWGHWAGSGRNQLDTDFIDQQLKNLLASS